MQTWASGLVVGIPWFPMLSVHITSGSPGGKIHDSGGFG